MKKKLTVILILFSLLVVGAALWQAHEAATLEERLLNIDRQTQANRLLELSLPRVQAEVSRLLAAEREKLGNNPPIGLMYYNMPEGGKADFNNGFFMITSQGVQCPVGDEGIKQWLNDNAMIVDTMRRKADNPAAPVIDPDKAIDYDPRVHLPVFSVYHAENPDTAGPLRMNGEPSPYFSWFYEGLLVYQRSIPTTHGNAAQGFIIDVPKLAARLLPLVEPGLVEPEIRLVQRGEISNLSPLPLVLVPGKQVNLPDSRLREKALSGTVASAWLISILSIIILFGLLAFYARLERRRSDFVSAVTHELRTPLTSFNLYTEMLRSGKLPPEKVAEYHETLYNESRRLGHLVENVLSFAKLTRGKVRGRQDSGSCSKLLPELFAKIKERLKKGGVDFHYTLDPRTTLLTLRTDLLSVEQILTNLADNALKYAEAEHPAISINVLQNHRSLAIRFADNGPGIPQELQKDLFRPFSRSAKSESGRKPGVGLGLALSRDLARSIGGELSLEKSDSKGSTFLLTLPLGE
ncbi:MAG: HAMP domain-containing histidine kinase [Akkermansia sp.]|nr:HAMP domain-containing histidine kinase [Akkermansia sp.]